MSGFGNRYNNNGNNQAPQGNNMAPSKEDVPNKVKFSSVKLGQTKQGSPTMGLYLKREEAEKLVTLVSQLLAAGEDGCKLACIVISGEKYDSGYTYVNPKEARQDQGQGQNQGNRGFQNGGGGNGGGYRKQNAGPNDRTAAKQFMQNKRIDDGEQKG